MSKLRGPGPFLILIYGQPLSLKSTLALQIAWRLNCGLVSTGFFGRVVRDDDEHSFRQARERRYSASAGIAKCYLEERWPVVVEGNFDTYRRREMILKLVRKTDIPVAMVRCVCSDAEELRRRQASRTSKEFALDREAKPYQRGDTTDVTIPLITSSELRGIDTFSAFEVDTGSWTLQMATSTPSLEWLDDVLRSWIRFAASGKDFSTA